MSVTAARRAVLTVFTDRGRKAAEHEVGLPAVLDRGWLLAAERVWLRASPCRYAVLREGGRVRAVYLAAYLVPRAAVRLSPTVEARGAWLVDRIDLGDHGEGLSGPDVFFRRDALEAGEAWMGPLLDRLPQARGLRVRAFDDGEVVEWEGDAGRVHYLARAARWRLYGGGTTPRERVEAIVARVRPETAVDYLTAIGAVPLGGP